jgi:DeoR family fructose operon transcriptional repressor
MLKCTGRRWLVAQHSALLTSERLDRIKGLVAERGTVRLADLVRELGASRETVRRDLATLAARGEIRRVRGGAVGLSQPTAWEPPYSRREIAMLEEKRAIAAMAASLVKPGESVYLDVGTTVLQVAQALEVSVTVITNSVPAALSALEHAGNTVVLLGGTLRPGDRGLSGADTLGSLERYFVDVAIVGVGGITEMHGVTDFHIEEAAVRRLAIARARRTIAVADHTKFGLVGMVAVCGLEALTCVVTDDNAPASADRWLERAGVQVIRASAGPNQALSAR